MSTVKIRMALETALATVTPALQTAYENAPFVTTVGVPYQRVTILMAPPDNPTMGSNFYRERGILYVGISYPLANGTAAIMTQAEVLKAFFRRGNSYAAGGVTVIVERTPEITTTQATSSDYSVVVKVRFWADIQ